MGKESKDKINYALKMNFNDFDYYFRTEEAPYNKQKYYIPINKTLQDGYYNRNISYVGLDIFINFKLKDGKIDKIYLSLKRKDFDSKLVKQSCGNDDQCPQICNENLNMCI